jgi:hypothetical protein
MITTNAETRPSNAMEAHIDFEMTSMPFCDEAIRSRSNANELFARKFEMMRNTWNARTSWHLSAVASEALTVISSHFGPGHRRL